MVRMTTEEADKILREIAKRYFASLTPQQRLRFMSPKERVQGLSAEEILAALTPEEREQLRAYLKESPKN